MTKKGNDAVRSAYCATYRLAQRLQEEHSDIADDFLAGMSPIEIARHHGFESVYSTSLAVARRAVSFALRGNEGYFGFSSLEGLVKRDVYDARLDDLRVKGGERLFASLSADERRRFALAASKVGGEAARDQRAGLCGLSREQRLDASRKSVLARGYTPFDEDELAALDEYAQHPDYQAGYRGANTPLIASRLNDEFHQGNDVRTGSSVSRRLSRLRKAQREREDEPSRARA